MNNKGVTIITLIVTILVILILSSIFISVGLDSLNEAKETEIKNEMYQLKQAVINKYTSYEKNDGKIALVGTSALSKWGNKNECIEKVIATLQYEDESMDEIERRKARVSGEIARDYDEFVMLIDSDARVKLGLENSSDNVYIVNYYTGSVYGPIE